MIVSFATQAGRTAEDGEGRNSPYTAAFLKNIETQEEIGTVFRRIADEVYSATNKTQLPEISLSVIGEFYLRGKLQVRVETPPAAAAVAPQLSEAAQVWATTRETASPAVLEAFIKRFGDTVYGELARARLNELKVAANNPPQAGQPAARRQTEALVPEAVPFITDADRVAIRRDYLPAREHKALAISQSRIGFMTGQPDDETASKVALASCQRASDEVGPGRRCELYAVGNLVVSGLGHPPMPPEPWFIRDQSSERPVAGKDVPLVSENARADIDKRYVTWRGHKALAISPRGHFVYYFGRAGEVVRRSLEWCGSNAGVSCMIIAVDDAFVVPIPSMMKVVGFFHVLGNAAIAPQTREDVAHRLDNAAAGWTAVAVGANGQPGIMLKAANEQDAINGALADCSRQDRSCRVIAIGPFSVEPNNPPTARNNQETKAVGAPPAPVPATASSSCSRESSSRSGASRQPTTISIKNDRSAPVRLYWLDPDGNRKLYATIEPGQTRVQQTYLTHPWIVADLSGTCIELYMPTEGSTQVSVK
jgi:hypothetical protein